jgi:hypothetical protein
MIAPHMANEPIRRPRPGPSARPGRVRCDVRITAELEISRTVDQHSSPSALQKSCCGQPLSPFAPQKSRCVCSFFAPFVPFVAPPVSARLRASASPRESFLAAAKPETRDFVDQQTSPPAPQNLRCFRPSFFVFFAFFVAPPISALLRGSASPRESFLGAARSEIRDFVDQQPSSPASQNLRCVCPPFASLMSLVDAPISARLRGSAPPREASLRHAKPEIRDLVDQQPSPPAPQKLRCPRPSLVPFVPFVDPKTAPFDRSKPQDLHCNLLRHNHLRHDCGSQELRRRKAVCRKHLHHATGVLTDTCTNGWCVSVAANRVTSITYNNDF